MSNGDLEELERQRFIKGKNGKPLPPKFQSKALPPRHPVNLIYRATVIGGSVYVLHLMEVFHNIMRSPQVNHEWFKVGLAASIGE